MVDEDKEMGYFEGWGSVFNGVDHGGDSIAKGAYTKSLEEWNNKSQLPALLWQHEMSNPIGNWMEMKEDDKGLYVKGQLWVKGTQRIEQAVVAHNMLTGTGPKGLSIGYAVKDFEMMEYEGGSVRLLKEIKLYEVSVVSYPMDPKAEITQAKSLVDGEGKVHDIRTFEKTLRDAGLSRSQAKTLISGGYKALCDTDDLDEKRGDSRDESLIDEDVLASLSTLFKG